MRARRARNPREPGAGSSTSTAAGPSVPASRGGSNRPSTPSTLGAPLPRFLRRILLAREARDAFLAGDLARALSLCAEPELELDPDARALAGAAIERLVRDAVRAKELGDDVALHSALELLARHAPERALGLRRELARPSEPEPASASARRSLQDFLAGLRAGPALARVAPAASLAENAVVPSSAPESEPPAGEPAPERAHACARLFHLAVDDGGEYLVASGERLVIGHLRSRTAELAFLADVDGEHAELVLVDSFHGGFRWRIVPRRSSELTRVNGVALTAEGALLSDGDRVELARNLAFRFVASETASSSALLELEHGVECRGALRILLLCPGSAGRVRIGPKRRRLISVADLTSEVALELRGDRLRIVCDGGLRQGGTEVPAGAGAELSVPCPPTVPIDVHLFARPRSRPPFLLLFRPLANEPGGFGT